MERLKNTQTPNPTLQIGDLLIYTNEGHNEMVYLVYINTNDPKSTNYIIKLLNRNIRLVTKELLKSRNVPDIVSILIYSEYYISECNNLAQD